MPCILCDKSPLLGTSNLCEPCYDAVFYIEDIIEDYFLGAGPHPLIAPVLKEFSFIYASYLQLSGYYNTTIQIMLHFVGDLTRDHITNADLNDFNFTKTPSDDIIDVLVQGELITRNPADPNRYERTPQAQNLAAQLRDALTINPNEIKEPAERFFGMISLILTNALIHRKMIDPTQGILPRKAISLFLLFASIINESERTGSPIPDQIELSLVKEQHNRIKLAEGTQNNFFLELLGFSIRSPGKTNIISRVDLSSEILYLKDTVINALTRLRDRKRNRIRIRGF